MDEKTLELQFAEKEEALKKEFAEKSAKMDEILKMFEGVDDLKKAVLDFQEQSTQVKVKEKLYTEQLAKAKEREVKEFVEGLVKDERILPVQAKLAEQIFTHLGEEVEGKELVFTNSKLYGFKEKMTLVETIRQFMASYPKIGMLKEYTSQKKLFNNKNEESEQLIKQYMDEHKVEYGPAQLAVYEARPELFSLNLDKAVDVDDQEDVEE